MTAPGTAPSSDPSDDSEFAAFVAELVAQAQEPTEEGARCREILADDPDQLREAWAIYQIATAGGSPSFSMSFLIVTLVAAGLSIAVAVWMMSWLGSALP